MQNDANYDWINDIPTDLGAEGDDIGNGNANDYGDEVLPQTKPEDIKPESELPDTTKKEKLPDGNDKPKAIMPKKPGAK